jgi:hypothetical protein
MEDASILEKPRSLRHGLESMDSFKSGSRTLCSERVGVFVLLIVQDPLSIPSMLPTQLIIETLSNVDKKSSPLDW